MAADLFSDTREALIDTGRRAGDREPIREHAEVHPGGAAPGRVDLTTAPLSATRAHAFGLGEDGAAGTCGTCAAWAGRSIGFGSCEHRRAWLLTSTRALCVLEPVRWTADAKRTAQRGIEQAVAAADRAIAGWSDFALEFVRLYAQRNHGKQYIGHDIVQASIAEVAQPPNPKAWGGPIQRAARAGYIKRIGFAEDPNRHGNPVPLWETA